MISSALGGEDCKAQQHPLWIPFISGSCFQVRCLDRPKINYGQNGVSCFSFSFFFFFKMPRLNRCFHSAMRKLSFMLLSSAIYDHWILLFIYYLSPTPTSHSIDLFTPYTWAERCDWHFGHILIHSQLVGQTGRQTGWQRFFHILWQCFFYLYKFWLSHSQVHRLT